MLTTVFAAGFAFELYEKPPRDLSARARKTNNGYRGFNDGMNRMWDRINRGVRTEFSGAPSFSIETKPANTSTGSANGRISATSTLRMLAMTNKAQRFDIGIRTSKVAGYHWTCTSSLCTNSICNNRRSVFIVYDLCVKIAPGVANDGIQAWPKDKILLRSCADQAAAMSE